MGPSRIKIWLKLCLAWTQYCLTWPIALLLGRWARSKVVLNVEGLAVVRSTIFTREKKWKQTITFLASTQQEAAIKEWERVRFEISRRHIKNMPLFLEVNRKKIVVWIKIED